MVGTTPSSQQPEGTPSSTHYSCIIVGAGISGIAASTVLTEKGISHLMLEAKDHIGGRIAPGTFAGLTIDLGANFIHDP
jgi:monoamine oxidase